MGRDLFGFDVQLVLFGGKGTIGLEFTQQEVRQLRVGLVIGKADFGLGGHAAHDAEIGDSAIRECLGKNQRVVNADAASQFRVWVIAALRQDGAAVKI
jgi:hypothetical protein